MRRALALASRGAGRTSPNPMVGASVVLDDGSIAGDGWHREAGGPHAEIHALDAAGPRSRGAMLVCTLEPCCHQGRTGPCVERIVAAGISHVVVATPDPNPRVNGEGFRYLRDQGVRVTVGVEEAAARRLNAAFFTRMRSGRPYVVLKAAVSVDGFIAAAPGVRTEISGPLGRRHAQRLRAEVDAIAVGSATVLVDDPLLTVRDVCRVRPFSRIIFDRRLRTRPDARVFTTLEAGPVWIVTAATERETDRARALEAVGAQLLAAEEFGDALQALGREGITSILLEGGTRLHVAAWEAGMIDRVVLYVAPHALGGGVPFLPNRSFSTVTLYDRDIRHCGADVIVEGHVHRAD